MDVQIRTITDDEFEECLRSLELSFSGSVTAEDMVRERLVLELDRWHAAFDDGPDRRGSGGGELPLHGAGRRAGLGGGRDRRRRAADASAPRDQRGAHAGAAGRRPRARRADRGAVRVRGRHLRPFRLRALGVPRRDRLRGRPVDVHPRVPTGAAACGCFPGARRSRRCARSTIARSRAARA